MCECSTIARSPTGGCSAWPLARASSAMANRQEVQSLVEIAVAGDLEVGRGDGGHETRVEGLREAEGRVHAVPAEPQRQLVQAQLAGVEDAQYLDSREARLQQRAVL